MIWCKLAKRSVDINCQQIKINWYKFTPKSVGENLLTDQNELVQKLNCQQTKICLVMFVYEFAIWSQWILVQTFHTHTHTHTHLTLLLLFSSACTDRRRGGTQLSVSSKVGGLEKGHPLSSEGVCSIVFLVFLSLSSWSTWCVYARRAGWLIGIHVMCPKHLTCCCLMCCRTGFAPAMSSITSFLILSRLVLFTAFFSGISFHKWPFFSRGLLLVTMSGTGMSVLVGRWH